MFPASVRANRLCAPPREIPPGLRLALLCRHDVLASNLYVVPAAVLLALGNVRTPPVLVRVALTVIGSVLLLLALQATLAALAAAMRELAIMRRGFSSVGRVVACRLPWERKGTDIAYAEFLGNWVVHTGKSQMRAATGCLSNLFAMGAFFLIGAPLLAIVAVLAYHGRLADLREYGPVIGGLAGTIVLFALLVRYWGRFQVDRVAAYVHWRRTTRPGKNDYFDEWAEKEARNSLELNAGSIGHDPLPEVDSVNLRCRVEYSPRPGERFAGEGVVRLRKGLDPGGVEPLIFDPDRPERVVFFAGLPDVARATGRGEWEPVDPVLPALKLGFTSLAWIVAIRLLVPHLAWLAQ